MKIWLVVFVFLLIVAPSTVSACAPQSDMSEIEVIYNVKQHEIANGMHIPLEPHWAAEYEGQGIWVVGMYCDRDEDNYPPDWWANGGYWVSDFYYTFNKPYIWRYYESSGDVESIVSKNEMREISQKHPRLLEGLVLYTE